MDEWDSPKDTSTPPDERDEQQHGADRRPAPPPRPVHPPRPHGT